MKKEIFDILNDQNIERKLLKLKNNPKLFFKDFYLNRINKNKIKKVNKGNVKNNLGVQRVNIGENAEKFFDRLKKLLLEFDIKFMLGAAPDKWMYGLHIDKSDLYFFLKMVDEWLNEGDIFVKVENDIYFFKDFVSLENNKQVKAINILIKEFDGINIKYCSYLHVMFWHKIESYSSENIYSILEENKYIHRLREETYMGMMSDHVYINNQDHALDVNFPIDIVYTWVDGDDPSWLKQKHKYQGVRLEDGDGTAGRAYSDERFRSRDELLYSLRSVELFAPFIRNIYIVTADQKPSWINTNNPRVKIISHSSIYKNKDHLPSFNSNSIETQLHHIDGLSEYFLYLNDDFMFADFCIPEDFFYANGALKFFPSEARAYIEDVDNTREEYLIAEKNNHDYLFEKYGKRFCYIMKHTPYPVSRTLMYQLENDFSNGFENCSANRFRGMTDIRPFSLQYAVGFYEGKAYPAKLTHRYLALYKPTIGEQFKNVVNTRKYKTICINDVGIDSDKLEKTNELTRNFLELYFPIKSQFEI